MNNKQKINKIKQDIQRENYYNESSVCERIKQNINLILEENFRVEKIKSAAKISINKCGEIVFEYACLVDNKNMNF